MRNRVNFEYLQPQHLRKLKIFSPLEDTELQQLLGALQNGIEDYASKEIIIDESEIGECMYIILEGSVEVYIKGSIEGDLYVETLNAGDYFGENAVLSAKPVKRTASVRAELPTKVFRIDKQCAMEAIKGHKQIRGRYPPDEVRDMIMSLPMFNSLNHEDLLTIRDWTLIVTYKLCEFIFKAGTSAECMYVILEGEVELLTLGDDGTIVVVSNHKKGDFFGEIYLIQESKSKYNLFARASIESRIIKIPKKYFRLLMSRDTKLVDNLHTIHKTNKNKIKELQTKYGK